MCSGGELPEVEIISLLEEQIPRYRLRADTLTQFTGGLNCIEVCITHKCLVLQDMICDMIWYILLTAIGLTPRGSSTVHIYTQTIHRTIQSTQTIPRTTQLTNWKECGPCPVFARYTLASALQMREKHGKNLSQGRGQRRIMVVSHRRLRTNYTPHL